MNQNVAGADGALGKPQVAEAAPGAALSPRGSRKDSTPLAGPATVDGILGKLIVHAGLVAFITLAYIGVVLAARLLLPLSERMDLALSLAATGAVAVAFHPVRMRIQGLATRMLGGGRAVPKETIEDLRNKLDELQQSRKRIVVAQDSERRRLEREIHDGAQQQLVSMSVKLGLAKQVLRNDPGRIDEVLDDLRADTRGALETLRDLARGLFPPVLEGRGLVSAVQAHVDREGLRAAVEDELGGARFPIDMEASLYFVMREALQYASKHFSEAPILIRLAKEDDALVCAVSGSGQGLSPGRSRTGQTGPGLRHMQDRLRALGGELQIESAPGEGTTIRGRVPVPKTPA